MAEINDYDTQRLVPRVVESGAYTIPFTMAHLILGTPCPIDQVDAIAVLPGLGEEQRLIAAIKAWEPSQQARHLLVAGTNGAERAQTQPDLKMLQAEPFNLKRVEGVETQVSAENTPDQTRWLVQRMLTLNIKSAALFVSHWHLTRAYGTLIKSLLDQSQEPPTVAIFPMSVATPPSAIVPEYGETVTTMSAGEAERIKKYQEMGDVVTLPELTGYLDWLWQQDIAPLAQPVHSA